MSITVLLADDHTVVREGLHLLLTMQPDIEVIGDAADGQAAVDLALAHCPDVAVLDIAMPVLNGIEAAARILSGCPGTAIVILSMHATRDHVLRALQAGVRGYLLKESAGEEVATAVRAVHAGGSYLSRKITDVVLDDYLAQQAAAAPPDPLARLSEREREVLQLVVEGRTSAEIGSLLALSPKTVETYRSRIMEKLGIGDLPALVRFAIQHGLISLDE
ncbi:MAG: response regulator transcription factor [Anaerolineae bacterium]